MYLLVSVIVYYSKADHMRAAWYLLSEPKIEGKKKKNLVLKL